MLEAYKLKNIPIWFHYNLYVFSFKCQTYFYDLQLISILNSNKTLVCMGAHLNLKIQLGSLHFLKHVYDGLFGVYGYSFELKTYLDNL